MCLCVAPFIECLLFWWSEVFWVGVSVQVLQYFSAWSCDSCEFWRWFPFVFLPWLFSFWSQFCDIITFCFSSFIYYHVPPWCFLEWDFVSSLYSAGLASYFLFYFDWLIDSVSCVLHRVLLSPLWLSYAQLCLILQPVSTSLIGPLCGFVCAFFPSVLCFIGLFSTNLPPPRVSEYFGRVFGGLGVFFGLMEISY